MHTILPARRRPSVALLALALALAAIAAMLIAPTPSLARTQAHVGVCRHAKHRPHACASSPGKSSKSHTRRAAAKAAHPQSATQPAKAKSPGGSTSTTYVPAVCEDASQPVREGAGRFSCDDGSEPTCEDEATPTPSANGKTLECAVPPGASEAEGAGVPACEDGSAPILSGGGSYLCDDGSEAVCEDGFAPTLAADGKTLLCTVAPEGEGEDEEASGG